MFFVEIVNVLNLLLFVYSRSFGLDLDYLYDMVIE